MAASSSFFFVPPAWGGFGAAAGCVAATRAWLDGPGPRRVGPTG